jgi:hypothetical protein
LLLNQLLTLTAAPCCTLLHSAAPCCTLLHPTVCTDGGQVDQFPFVIITPERKWHLTPESEGER